jgi:hypothetical protein
MNDQCRSCRAKIVWCVTENGRRNPIDPEPVLGGNLIVKDRTVTPPMVKVVKPNPNVKRFVSHFVTCPQSKNWRKKDGKLK